MPDPQGMSLLLDHRRSSPSGLLYDVPARGLRAVGLRPRLAIARRARGGLRLGHRRTTRDALHEVRAAQGRLPRRRLELRGCGSPSRGDHIDLRAGSLGRDDQFYDFECSPREPGCASAARSAACRTTTRRTRRRSGTASGSQFLALPPGLSPAGNDPNLLAGGSRLTRNRHRRGAARPHAARGCACARCRTCRSIAQYGLEERKRRHPGRRRLRVPRLQHLGGARHGGARARRRPDAERERAARVGRRPVPDESGLQRLVLPRPRDVDSRSSSRSTSSGHRADHAGAARAPARQRLEQRARRHRREPALCARGSRARSRGRAARRTRTCCRRRSTNVTIGGHDLSRMEHRRGAVDARARTRASTRCWSTSTCTSTRGGRCACAAATATLNRKTEDRLHRAQSADRPVRLHRRGRRLGTRRSWAPTISASTSRRSPAALALRATCRSASRAHLVTSGATLDDAVEHLVRRPAQAGGRQPRRVGAHAEHRAQRRRSR